MKILNDQKRCPGCKDIKLKLDFSKAKSNYDGLNSICRLCDKVKKAKYRADNKEKISDARKAHYIDNKEKTTITNKIWYEKNRDKRRASDKAWRDRNRPKLRALLRSRKRGLKNKMWPQEKGLIDSIYADRPVGHDVDHIIPIKGVNKNRVHVVSGLHVVANLQYMDSGHNQNNKWAWFDPETFAGP